MYLVFINEPFRYVKESPVPITFFEPQNCISSGEPNISVSVHQRVENLAHRFWRLFALNFTKLFQPMTILREYPIKLFVNFIPISYLQACVGFFDLSWRFVSFAPMVAVKGD